ncbi:acyltransferase [Brachybacterium sp. YJGR34]|uniref:acyltransferase family protein n=1 Tax=Brachybacterium sp. YJGR34 TaxID=2059911 RepID=UPI000E0A7659|nr:acyltransferase [Brachybacterium sp. YJGR34]
MTTASSPAGVPATGGRLAWLDLARAMSIVLVVVYHVGVSGGAELLGEGPAATWWREANLALIPLRMPLFFLVAGVLAAGALQRPWSRVLRPRILDLLWPYVLWSLLFAATGWPRYAPDDPSGFLRGEITGMAVIGSPYWFIAALPVFFVLSRLLRRHRGAALALALLAYAAAPWLQRVLEAAEAPRDLVYGIFQLTDNALWYVLGWALHEGIRAAGRRPRPLTGLALALCFGALAASTLRPELPLPLLRSIELGASLTGIGACIALLPLLARWAPLARLGGYLGSRTLVIYLVHPIVLNLVVVLWRRGDLAGATDGTAADLLLVPALSILAIGAALVVDAVLARTGPAWLLAAPGGRRARPGGEMPNSARPSGGPPGQV